MAREPKASPNTATDTGEPTVSTSAEDASTLEGATGAPEPAPSVDPPVDTPPADVPTETPAPAGDTASEPNPPEPAGTGEVDPQRVIIEQAPPEPAVFYGDDALVPGTGSATDQNRPHVQADYQPFEW